MEQSQAHATPNKEKIHGRQEPRKHTTHESLDGTLNVHRIVLQDAMRFIK